MKNEGNQGRIEVRFGRPKGMDQMEGVIDGKMAYFWKISATQKLTFNQENQATNEMSASQEKQSFALKWPKL